VERWVWLEDWWVHIYIVFNNFPMFNQIIFRLFSTFFRVTSVKKVNLYIFFPNVCVTSLSICIWGFFVSVFQQVVKMSHARKWVKVTTYSNWSDYKFAKGERSCQTWHFNTFKMSCFSFYEHGKKSQSFPLWHCRNVVISTVDHYKAIEIC
jgi:hypothetical protein